MKQTDAIQYISAMADKSPDEPVIVFRARDAMAMAAMQSWYYAVKNLARVDSTLDMNSRQALANKALAFSRDQISAFLDWQDANRQLMKLPGLPAK